MSIPVEWVDRIFERLTVLFGRRFGDLYAGVDQDRLREAWAIELGGFRGHPERIAKALQSCKGAQHPPTLSEFVSLCRTQHADAPIGLLSAPKGDPVVAKENLERIKQMLRSAVKRA